MVYEMTKKLNNRQRAFIDEYIIDMNATQAAIRAGYSKKTARSQGQRLLTHVDIKHELDKRMKEKEKERIMQQDEVLEFLTSIARGEITEQTLIGDGEGYQRIGDIDVSAKDRIKAAELIGKRYAMWTDKQEVTQRNIEITLGDYDDED